MAVAADVRARQRLQSVLTGPTGDEFVPPLMYADVRPHSGYSPGHPQVIPGKTRNRCTARKTFKNGRPESEYARARSRTGGSIWSKSPEFVPRGRYSRRDYCRGLAPTLNSPSDPRIPSPRRSNAVPWRHGCSIRDLFRTQIGPSPIRVRNNSRRGPGGRGLQPTGTELARTIATRGNPRRNQISRNRTHESDDTTIPTHCTRQITIHGGNE